MYVLLAFLKASVADREMLLKTHDKILTATYIMI